MSALAIAQLLEAIAALIPGLLNVANEIKSTASVEDQATLSAAITAFQKAASADLATAEADLDAAAES